MEIVEVGVSYLEVPGAPSESFEGSLGLQR